MHAHILISHNPQISEIQYIPGTYEPKNTKFLQNFPVNYNDYI